MAAHARASSRDSLDAEASAHADVASVEADAAALAGADAEPRPPPPAEGADDAAGSPPGADAPSTRDDVPAPPETWAERKRRFLDGGKKPDLVVFRPPPTPSPTPPPTPPPMPSPSRSDDDPSDDDPSDPSAAANAARRDPASSDPSDPSDAALPALVHPRLRGKKLVVRLHALRDAPMGRGKLFASVESGLGFFEVTRSRAASANRLDLDGAAETFAVPFDTRYVADEVVITLNAETDRGRDVALASVTVDARELLATPPRGVETAAPSENTSSPVFGSESNADPDASYPDSDPNDDSSDSFVRSLASDHGAWLPLDAVDGSGYGGGVELRATCRLAPVSYVTPEDAAANLSRLIADAHRIVARFDAGEDEASQAHAALLAAASAQTLRRDEVHAEYISEGSSEGPSEGSSEGSTPTPEAIVKKILDAPMALEADRAWEATTAGAKKTPSETKRKTGGLTLLARACARPTRRGGACAAALLALGADPNATSLAGTRDFSPLHFAADAGATGAAEALLAAGAAPSAMDASGTTPFEAAVLSAAPETIAVEAIRAGAARGDFSRSAEARAAVANAARIASARGAARIVAACVEALEKEAKNDGEVDDEPCLAHLRSASPLAETPAHAAARVGDAALCRFFRARFSDARVSRDALGRTPGHVAASRGHAAALEALEGAAVVEGGGAGGWAGVPSGSPSDGGAVRDSAGTGAGGARDARAFFVGAPEWAAYSASDASVRAASDLRLGTAGEWDSARRIGEARGCSRRAARLMEVRAAGGA